MFPVYSYIVNGSKSDTSYRWPSCWPATVVRLVPAQLPRGHIPHFTTETTCSTDGIGQGFAAVLEDNEF